MTITNTNKIFPIVNDAACVYKWGWNTLGLYDGVTASCHRTEHAPITIENFENFHNSDMVISSRKLMLKGQWPPDHVGCTYCKKLEDHGEMSDRTFHNTIPGLTPVDFDDDQLHVTPRILEMYLNNTCDLRCVYCLPSISSRFNSELKQYGPIPTQSLTSQLQYTPPHKDQQKFLELLLVWMDKNYSKLTRLSVLGGEPFFQSEFNTVLDFIKTQTNRDLTLSIHTNLNAKPDRLIEYIELIKSLILNKQIKKAAIICSIDCVGPVQEFIRDGLDFNHWQKNFEYLIQHKWVDITVQHTVTSLSIRSIAELQSYINDCKKINPNITQAYQLVDDHRGPLYTPKIFGKDFFSKELDAILKLMPLTSDREIRSYKRLESIVNLVKNSQINVEALRDLKITLDSYDQRRNNDWKVLFPEINEFFIRNNI